MDVVNSFNTENPSLTLQKPIRCRRRQRRHSNDSTSTTDGSEGDFPPSDSSLSSSPSSSTASPWTYKSQGYCKTSPNLHRRSPQNYSNSNQRGGGRHHNNNSRNNRNNKNNKKNLKASRRSRKNQTPTTKLTEDDMLPPLSQFIALDCEMVGVGPNGHRSIVARVTAIDWQGQTLMDEYIRPTEDVTDYRTFVSGITSQQLEDHETTISLEECRTRLCRDILQNESKILVGHALKNDLRSLGISYPWYLIRDTAKYDPFMQIRFQEDGILWPRKLKELAKERLDMEIQDPSKPHSPFEDAYAALQLYQSVRCKWERVIEYKIKKTNEIVQQQQKEMLQQQHHRLQQQQELQMSQ